MSSHGSPRHVSQIPAVDAAERELLLSCAALHGKRRKAQRVLRTCWLRWSQVKLQRIFCFCFFCAPHIHQTTRAGLVRSKLSCAPAPCPGALRCQTAEGLSVALMRRDWVGLKVCHHTLPCVWPFIPPKTFFLIIFVDYDNITDG